MAGGPVRDSIRLACRVAALSVVCFVGRQDPQPAAAADPAPAEKPATGKPATGKPAATSQPALKPTVVKLVQSDGGCKLLRGGQPYFIQGAGGDGPQALLAHTGANSVRTWGTDHLDKVLDEAQRNGLSVAVGIWLGHERHGFNYNDADQVAAQFENVREIITRYKDHPAVLLWGLGNEMEGYAAGDNAAIWSAINNLATLAKKLDPNHPTMTVVAEIGGDRVKNLHRLCGDVDIVGINCYAGIASLDKRYQEAGGTKPYIVTEFGPPGMWETQKNGWGAVSELTSSEKAERYRAAWQAIAAARRHCLGGYAFTWGNKQEATATWFGMLLPDGSRLGAVDALTQLWSGKPPENRCPRIESLALDESTRRNTAKPDAAQPDGRRAKLRRPAPGKPASASTTRGRRSRQLSGRRTRRATRSRCAGCCSARRRFLAPAATPKKSRRRFPRPFSNRTTSTLSCGCPTKGAPFACMPMSATITAEPQSPMCRCTSAVRPRFPSRRRPNCRWRFTTKRIRSIRPTLRPAGWATPKRSRPIVNVRTIRTPARPACGSTTAIRKAGPGSSGRVRPAIGETGPAVGI